MKTSAEMAASVLKRRDEYLNKQKKRRTRLAAIGTPCLAAALIALVLILKPGDTALPQTAPFPDDPTIQTPTDPEPQQEPEPQSEPEKEPQQEPQPQQKPEAEISDESEMTDDEENSGFGGDDYNYVSPFALNFDIRSSFENMVDPEKNLAWQNQFAYICETGTREAEEHNIYNFVHELNIPREEFEEVNGKLKLHYSEEEVDLIYADDPEGAYAHFANPCGVRRGKIVYTPKWLVENEVEEWRKVGITPEEMETVLLNVKEYLSKSTYEFLKAKAENL